MRFSVLASGSRGNATIVEAEGYRILIDCGISHRELSRRLALRGEDSLDINSVFITHFHSDHIKGLPTFLEKVQVDLFASRRFPSLGFGNAHHYLTPLSEVEVGPFRILPLPLPHDNGGSLGFFITIGAFKFVFATDLGFATDDLVSAIAQADAVVLESNHDLQLLSSCAYPHFIKERIRSAEGHLSNCQTADLLATSLNPLCQHVVLAHLSERANNPRMALTAARGATSRPVVAASQSEPTEWFVLKSEQPVLATSVVAPSLSAVA